MLGVAGAAAACTAGVSVVANRSDGNAGPDGGSAPKGPPAQPVGLAAGIAGITAPTSDKASAKAYDKTGYRSAKPPASPSRRCCSGRPSSPSTRTCTGPAG